MKPSGHILMQEILKTTMKIKDEFPEKYNSLNETPLTITYLENKISDESYKQYLESLKLILNKNVKAKRRQV